MQIKVSRNELFTQLPRSVRRAMIGEDIPELFVFEIEHFDVGQFPEEGKMRAEFSECYKNFTNNEWFMFCMLLMHEGKEVPYSVLRARTRGKGESKNPNNVVNVHIKNVLIKLREFNVPVRIVTMREGIGHPGAYKLERI